MTDFDAAASQHSAELKFGPTTDGRAEARPYDFRSALRVST